MTIGAFGVAKLGGAQEVPAVTSGASGIVVTRLIDGDTALWYSLMLTGPTSGNVTAAHFHGPANATATAGALFVIPGLSATVTTAPGVWRNLSASTVAALVAGRVYVNVHTTGNPSGEVRGNMQGLVAASSSLFHGFAALSGADQVPALNTTATGTAVFQLDAASRSLKLNVVLTSLSGPVTGAHLHRGTPGTNGAPLLTFTAMFTGFTAQGAFSQLTDETLLALQAGAVYINVRLVKCESCLVRDVCVVQNARCVCGCFTRQHTKVFSIDMARTCCYS